MIRDTFLLRFFINCLVMSSVLIVDDRIPGTMIPKVAKFKKRKNVVNIQEDYESEIY
jgi:hypothetical protein